MEYQITLQPSGRTFTAESEETLLQAALRAGASIPYKCSNGSCGLCLAHRKVGEISQNLPHDFRINEADKLAGKILLCRNHPGSDMEIEVHEITNAKEIKKQNIQTTVSKILFKDDNHMVMELITPRSDTLQFLAGQFVDMSIDGQPGSFHGAIGSCPCNGMLLQFHLQRSDDTFIEYLFSRLAVGDKVNVSGPYGEFTFKEQHNHPAIFVAKDHHFAGIKSLIEQAINLEFDQPVRLYWIMTQNRQHYMENYCRMWANHFTDYEFIPLQVSDKIMRRGDVKKLVKMLVNEYPQLDFDLYLSMSKSRARTTKRYLYDIGFKPERVMSVSKNIQN